MECHIFTIIKKLCKFSNWITAFTASNDLGEKRYSPFLEKICRTGNWIRSIFEFDETKIQGSSYAETMDGREEVVFVGGKVERTRLALMKHRGSRGCA